MEEQQYKSSFVRALAERWEFWKPMAVDKVNKMDRGPRMVIRSALDTFNVFNRMSEFFEKLDGDDKVRLVIGAEIKALAEAIAIDETLMFAPTEDVTVVIASTEPTIEEEPVPMAEEPVEEVEEAEESSETWEDHGSNSLVKVTAPEEPESQYVQVLDPDTDRWQIVDRDTGEVTNRKKSPGPYKDVPTMEEVKDAGDGEGDEQANSADQAEAE